MPDIASCTQHRCSLNPSPLATPASHRSFLRLSVVAADASLDKIASWLRDTPRKAGRETSDEGPDAAARMAKEEMILLSSA